MTNKIITASQLPSTAQINSGIGIFNRVQLTVDLQTPYNGELLTIPAQTRGTVTASTSDYVKVKLDFHPVSEDEKKPFYLEVLAPQIELVDPLVVIDPQFRSFITPLAEDEKDKLHRNLLLDGCREPLVVWQGQNILLDGHHRFEICTKYNLSYQIVYVNCSSRESAFNWIINNQLGRRNLTPEAMSYLRGKLYNFKKQQGRRFDLTSGQSGDKFELNPLTSGQNGDKLADPNLTSRHFDDKLDKEIAKKTAQRLAEQYKVGERTIQRDGKFAEAVDTLADTLGESVRQGILSRDANLNKKKTLELAAIATHQPEEIIEQFEDGRYVAPLKSCPFPYQDGEVVKLLTKNELQLKGFRGCWAIIRKKYEYSADLVMWNGTAQNIHPQFMESLNYTPAQCSAKHNLQQRIQTIINHAPEVMAMQLLSLFGKKTSADLTALEEKMLALLEEEYGITTSEFTNQELPVASQQITWDEDEDEEEDDEEDNIIPCEILLNDYANIETEFEPILDIEKLPDNSKTIHRFHQNFPHQAVNNRLHPYNLLPSYQRQDLIDLITIHTLSNGWTRPQDTNGFLQDIYGRSNWQEMSDAEVLHCLYVVRCVKYFYFDITDYVKKSSLYESEEQVIWLNQLYQVVGITVDWTRVILEGIEPTNQGNQFHAHPWELKKVNQ
jgi:hypothetical protein